MTAPAPSPKPTRGYWNGSNVGPICPCGERLLSDRRVQGEMQHSYFTCANGHKWCKEQIGWEQWEWITVPS